MTETTQQTPEKDTNSRSKKPVFIGVGLVILLIVGGLIAAYFVLQGQSNAAYDQGESGLATGDNEAAITAFNEAIAVQPEFVRQQDTAAMIGRAKAHLGDENYQAAVDDATAVLQIETLDDQQQLDMLLIRSGANQALGNWASVLDDLSAAQVLDPSQTMLQEKIAEAYVAMADNEQALLAYETAVSANPESITAHLGYLRLLAEAGALAEVVARSEALIALDDALPKPHMYQGLAHAAYREDTAALASLAKATALPEAQIATALIHYLNGMYDAAMGSAALTLNEDSENALALAVMGAAEMGQGSQISGLEKLNQAASIASEEPMLVDGISELAKVLYVRGMAHLHNGRFDAAQADADQLVALMPDWSWGYVLRGDVNLAQGKTPQALFDYEQAVSIDPDFGVAYASLAQGNFQDGDFATAQANAERSLAILPEYVPAMLVAADAAVALEDIDDALAQLESALVLNGNSLPVLADRGDLYKDLAEWEKAVADYDVVLAETPEHLEALNGRSQALMALSEFDAALTDLDAALLQTPSAVDLIVRRAEAYLMLDELTLAAKDARCALLLDEDLAHMHYILGLVELENNNAFQAVVALTDAIDLDDEFAEAYAARGRAHLALNDPDRAKADAARAVDLNAKLAEGYMVRALVNGYRYEWSDALNDADLAIELSPEDVDTFETRGFVYLDGGDANEALDDFDSLLAIEPESVNGRLYRAATLDELRRHDDAIVALTAALEVAEDVSDIELAESLKADIERIPEAIDGTRTWADTYNNFSITYPEDWRQYVDPGTTTPLAIVGPFDKDYRANILLDILEFDFVPAASELARFIGSDFNQFDDYEMVSERSLNVGGRSAVERVFTWTSSDRRLSDLGVTVIQVYIVNGQRAFVITAYSRSEDIEKYQQIFNEMINSVTFE